MFTTPAPHDRPVLEASLESGEVVVDALTRSDVLAEVPVIGTAVKICKAFDAIRDKVFATKLASFVVALSGLPEETKDRVKKKMSASSEEAQKVGETLFLVIERMTSLEKPLLLAQVFIAYVDGLIDSSELRRLAHSIDASFDDDLKNLLTLHDPPATSQEPWMQYLSTSGLTRVVQGQTYDDLTKTFYEITKLGHKLREAHFHGRKYTANSSNLQRTPASVPR